MVGGGEVQITPLLPLAERTRLLALAADNAIRRTDGARRIWETSLNVRIPLSRQIVQGVNLRSRSFMRGTPANRLPYRPSIFYRH